MQAASSLSIIATAPGALRKAGPRSWAALGWWALLAGIICFGLAELMVRGFEPLTEWLLTRYLPQRYLGAGRWAIETLAGEQLRSTLVSITVTGSMLCVSVLLFVLKERASAVFEHDSGAAEGRRGDEAPLWRIALEEVWLVILYAALSMASFWIGYGAPTWRQICATVLTHLVLGFTLAADYIAPAMQRHGFSYPQIVRCIWRRPILSITFGLLFGAPMLAAVHLFGKPLPVEIESAIAKIALTQLLCLAAAIWVGTWVGGRLVLQEDPKTAPGLPATVHLSTFALITFSGLTFGSLCLSAYRALPLLRCHYALVPGEWDVDVGRASASLALSLQIENPTQWDAQVGPNRLELKHRGAHLLQTQLPQATVPAKSRQAHAIVVPLELEGGVLRKGLSMAWTLRQDGYKAAAMEALGGAADFEAYELTLYLETPLMEFPVYLTKPAKAGAVKRSAP